ncbi:hypothetical protein BM528_13630 [Alteromonas sp. RW2A1]|uniref:TnsA endonuclease N-terminal domain-containing protein n=1 Tax=Alteromonas sp. RW2A1 TaxID=1917158 RepID=UPI0009039199|nr:TnsA endonuclease N-terminal domain-containing protein [Alteromonas sp. RW2A1]APE06681.1 hypothetical protein BM528_13630 [Alteromonas sp. RW2A1]
MKENKQISGFYTVGNQPPVTWLTLNRIAKWEEEVLSTQQYVPYIKVKRSPTVGKGSKVFNPESDQTHEVLSILETQLLRYLAFVPNITSVKTQYPLLPISNTLEIADAMSVKHPSYRPKGKHIRHALKVDQAVVMTSDFLIDYTDGEGELHQCALALKTVNDDGDFSDKAGRDLNIRNKLNIEAEYWRNDGIEWRLITSAQHFCEDIFARNLLEAEARSEREIGASLLQDIETSFIHWFSTSPHTSFAPLLKEIAGELGISTGEVRVAFWKLIWQQRLPVDISKEIIFNRPVPLGGKQWIWR